MRISLSFLLIFAAVFVQRTYGQDIPIGSWRIHASYVSAHTVAVAQKNVYAGGSLFAYDTEYEQATPLSRLDGFSGINISKLAFDIETQTLVVTYVNGAIDLLKGNSLVSLQFIAQSTGITASKKASHILIYNKLAYLAYDFGVVVIDLVKQQIRESYLNLGSGGTELAIYGTAINQNQIYLATAAGILTAPLAGVNLQDYANWQPVTGELPGGAVMQIAAWDTKIYAAFATHEVYEFSGNQWVRNATLPNESALFLTASQGRLLAGYPGKIVSLESQKPPQLISHPFIQSPQEAEYDASGHLWIADAVTGLLGNASGVFKVYAPNGPVSNRFQRLARKQTDIVALPGGYTGTFAPALNPTGFSVFTTTGWQNSTTGNTETSLQLPPVTDLLAAAYNAVNQELYVASFGDGILIKKLQSNWQRLTETNAPPQTARITGLVADTTGTLWAAIYATDAAEPSLYARSKDGQWRSFVFTPFAANQPTHLLIDDYGYCWMSLASGGLWVFDPATNRGRLLSTAVGQGGIPNNLVYSIAKDALGQLWIGTGRGAAYFYNPYNVFENQPFDAIAPIFDGRPVLRDEVVTTIRIDGGNRKWFGTHNGAWLFNADITEQVAHFTTQHTPLLSDAILDVEIQPSTGEVFFSTEAGLISYRGTATESKPQHNQVKVFPNPVRPEFDGTVGISGLATNCIVKVTDVSGRLVYQTRSNGGTATWKVQDYKGRRVASGVYLIFASSDDGSEKQVAKIAVLE